MRNLGARVLYVCLAAASLAISARPAAAQNGFINIDFARFVSRQDAYMTTFVTTINLEAGAAAAAYPKLPGANGIDLSGGVRVVGHLGVGVRFEAANYDETVGLGVSIPSPYFFNTVATAGSTTSPPLHRRDRYVDVSAQYSIPITNKVTLSVFGGPTYFHVSQDMVSVIHYLQTASSIIRLNAVTIHTFTSQEVSGSTWGGHAGADIAFFFTDHVGVGGGGRYNAGTVKVTDPLSAQQTDLKVGFGEFGAGLRLRF
jgi:hypothetical protein